jgi:hypothetical protein
MTDTSSNVPAVRAEPAHLPTVRAGSVFDNLVVFEEAQRMARVLSSSALAPAQYQGPQGLANSIIALDMSRRMRLPPLTVMQNLNIIHGKPSWSATFIIAAISSCGLFSPLRFKNEGEGDAMSCYAYAVELSTGETLRGPKVTIAMAKAEGWYGRSGSKWPTMPEQMLTYRAASFFGRIYASHILAGLQSSDEVDDAPPRVVEINPRAPAAASGEPVAIAAINAEAQTRRGRGRAARQEEQPAAPAAPAAAAAPEAEQQQPAAPAAAAPDAPAPAAQQQPPEAQEQAREPVNPPVVADRDMF